MPIKQIASMPFHFSALTKVGNGAVQCSWIDDRDQQKLRLIVRNAILPLGVSEYEGKLTAKVSLDPKSHKQLIDEFKDIVKCAQKRFDNFDIADVVTETNFGLEFRVKITDETKFFNIDKVPGTVDLIRQKQSKVDLMISPYMLWVKDGKGGVSVKALQVKSLHNGVEAMAVEEDCEI
tara:strand:+ start:322 stop:855 length:534 start_codon:yes stop_codon:yes gene_type:complete